MWLLLLTINNKKKIKMKQNNLKPFIKNYIIKIINNISYTLNMWKNLKYSTYSLASIRKLNTCIILIILKVSFYYLLSSVSLSSYIFPIEAIDVLVTNIINSFNASFMQVLKPEEIIINYPSDIESQINDSSLSMGFLLLILTKNNNLNKLITKIKLLLGKIRVSIYTFVYNINKINYINKINKCYIYFSIIFTFISIGFNLLIESIFLLTPILMFSVIPVSPFLHFENSYIETSGEDLYSNGVFASNNSGGIYLNVENSVIVARGGNVFSNNHGFNLEDELDVNNIISNSNSNISVDSDVDSDTDSNWTTDTESSIEYSTKSDLNWDSDSNKTITPNTIKNLESDLPLNEEESLISNFNKKYITEIKEDNWNSNSNSLISEFRKIDFKNYPEKSMLLPLLIINIKNINKIKNKITNYLSKLFINININILYYLNIYNILCYINKFNLLIFKSLLLLLLSNMIICVTPLIITDLDNTLTNIHYAGLYSKNYIDTYPTFYNNKIAILKDLIKNMDDISNKLYDKTYYQGNKFKIYISLLENKKLLFENIPKIQSSLVYNEEIIKTLIQKNNILTKEFLNSYLFNSLDSPERNKFQEDYLFKLNDHIERTYYWDLINKNRSENSIKEYFIPLFKLNFTPNLLRIKLIIKKIYIKIINKINEKLNIQLNLKSLELKIKNLFNYSYFISIKILKYILILIVILIYFWLLSNNFFSKDLAEFKQSYSEVFTLLNFNLFDLTIVINTIILIPIIIELKVLVIVWFEILSDYIKDIFKSILNLNLLDILICLMLILTLTLTNWGLIFYSILFTSLFLFVSEYYIIKIIEIYINFHMYNNMLDIYELGLFFIIIKQPFIRTAMPRFNIPSISDIIITLFNSLNLLIVSTSLRIKLFINKLKNNNYFNYFLILLLLLLLLYTSSPSSSSDFNLIKQLENINNIDNNLLKYVYLNIVFIKLEDPFNEEKESKYANEIEEFINQDIKEGLEYFGDKDEEDLENEEDLDEIYNEKEYLDENNNYTEESKIELLEEAWNTLKNPQSGRKSYQDIREKLDNIEQLQNILNKERENKNNNNSNNNNSNNWNEDLTLEEVRDILELPKYYVKEQIEYWENFINEWSNKIRKFTSLINLSLFIQIIILSTIIYLSQEVSLLDNILLSLNIPIFSKLYKINIISKEDINNENINNRLNNKLQEYYNWAFNFNNNLGINFESSVNDELNKSMWFNSGSSLNNNSNSSIENSNNNELNIDKSMWFESKTSLNNSNESIRRNSSESDSILDFGNILDNSLFSQTICESGEINNPIFYSLLPILLFKQKKNIPFFFTNKIQFNLTLKNKILILFDKFKKIIYKLKKICIEKLFNFNYIKRIFLLYIFRYLSTNILIPLFNLFIFDVSFLCAMIPFKLNTNDNTTNTVLKTNTTNTGFNPAFIRKYKPLNLPISDSQNKDIQELIKNSYSNHPYSNIQNKDIHVQEVNNNNNNNNNNSNRDSLDSPNFNNKPLSIKQDIIRKRDFQVTAQIDLNNFNTRKSLGTQESFTFQRSYTQEQLNFREYYQRNRNHFDNIDEQLEILNRNNKLQEIENLNRRYNDSSNSGWINFEGLKSLNRNNSFKNTFNNIKWRK
jgi:hypothetical protein